MAHWPDIPFERFKTTGASLHMWLQIVGKFRLALTPWMNHSWQATFYVNARGLTSGAIPGRAANYETQFDFIDQELKLLDTEGRIERVPLEAVSVATFHERFTQALERIGAPVDFHGAPNEVPDPTPFRDQTGPGEYDPQAAQDFWRALVKIDNVFNRFRTGFLGKSSPSHLFWGSLDLAVTRFSGRDAPLHPGGFPALPDEVTREAYSHEVSSSGFWAGGGGVDYPAFYSYAYPTPDGFKDAKMAHEHAFWHEELGEYVLPYDAVRNAPDPDQALLDFLQATYEAAADAAGWDRKNLDGAIGRPGQPRPVG